MSEEKQKIILNRAGFTLVELATVILIVGILSAITIPNYKNFVIKSKNASVKSNMHTIQLGVEDFAMLNDGVYPVPADDAALRNRMSGGNYPDNPFTKNPTVVVWNANPAISGEISIFNLPNGGYQIKGHGKSNILDLVLQMED